MRLGFDTSTVVGGGSDDTGPFTVVGSYSSDDTVELFKIYSTHIFRYEGKWDGSMIFGKAHQVGLESNCSVFEMWPEGEDVAIEFGIEEEAEALTIPRELVSK